MKNKLNFIIMILMILMLSSCSLMYELFGPKKPQTYECDTGRNCSVTYY